jgi:hypothetical protein
MKKCCTAGIRYFLLTLSLAACDFSENEPAQPINKPETRDLTPVVPDAPTEAIDLTISPEMIEALQLPGEEQPVQTETPPTSLMNRPGEKSGNVSFSGKVHLDEEDEQKKYLDSVDGAEINVEVKFE